MLVSWLPVITVCVVTGCRVVGPVVDVTVSDTGVCVVWFNVLISSVVAR